MPRTLLFGVLGVLLVLPACSGPAQVTTRADLEAQLHRNPNDVNALRELGIIYANERNYPRASEHLQRAFERRSDDPRTIYYLGLVSEVLGREPTAMRLYERYGEVPATSPYRDRLRGRYHWLLRRQLRTELREALAREDELTSQPTGDAVAVIPFTYRGGEARFEPLGRGLAEMVSVDLANVRQLTVVERVRTQVLLSELELARSGHIDPETAPRYGRLLRAGRLVGGQFNAQNRQLRVDAGVYAADDEGLPELATTTGPVDRLFDVQKEVVARLLESLGVALTPEQRALIARVPTRNVDAFIAYSRGLQAEDLTDLDQAVRFYEQAVRLDPAFAEAQMRASEVEAMRTQQGDPTTMLAATGPGAAVGGPGDNLVARRLHLLNAALSQHLIPGPDTREAELEGVGGGLLGRLPDPPPPPAGGN